MMKTIKFALILSLLIAAPGMALERLNDVPQSNPAYDSVYDLMQRGVDVTQGHPDGTFDGNKYITKYEMAYMMASLALSFKRSAPEKIDVSDIREELNWLKVELASIKDQPEAKKEISIYGSAALKSEFGSIFYYDNKNRAPLGPETTYRLKLTVEKALGSDSSIKINLDTMDGGFNSQTARDLPMKLLDIEGRFLAETWLENPVQIKAIVGPGSVKHTDTSGVAPSEDGIYFSRPRPTLSFSSDIGNYYVESGFAARGMQVSGLVGTSEVFLKFKRKYPDVWLIGTTEAETVSRYIFADFMDPSSGPATFRQELSFLMRQNSNVAERIMFGASSTDHPISQFYLNMELYLTNINNAGTNMNFYFNSVGANYRAPFEALEFTPLNIFRRKILDGTIDVGLELTHPLSDDLTLSSRTEWTGSSNWELAANIKGASITHEFALDYRLNRDLTFNTFFRYYYVPSGIAQFNTAVPVLSDITGIGLTYKF